MRGSVRKLNRLLEEVADVRRLLILPHDNPDPDALASGWLLGHILRRVLGTEVTLAYEGIVGRAENRAMVDLLRIPLVPLSSLNPKRFDAVALVDTQPGTGNNSLPEDLLPLVVFDHHPSRPSTRDVPFCDIRPDYGATATIMWEYLHAAGLPCRRRYATGLFYAIRSETQNLGREGGNPDVRAYVSLFPHVDNRIISRIEQAPISRKYLALLNGAFLATRLYDDLSITRLARMPYPDVPAELADMLLRVDQVNWALVMGVYRGALYISIRTQDARANAGLRLRQIVEPEGRAGGHGMMAGGKADLRKARLSADEVMRLFARRARELHGTGGVRGKALLRGR